MRKVYASYVKKQLEEQPNSVVLFLSYYDTTDTVRGVLSSNGVHVKEHEKNGSMIILDIRKVLHNPYFQVPNIEKLRELARKIKNNSAIRQYSYWQICQCSIIQKRLRKSWNMKKLFTKISR